MVSTEKARKSDETRERIVRAFTRCVAENGYAHTKLQDIAEQASLAPPHLRYYFKNKESILEFQYERIVARFEEIVLNLSASSTRGWFDAFAKIVFDGDPLSIQSRLVLIEANILAARSQRMLALKQAYDANMLKALEQQFAAAGLRAPEHEARVTFHFLTGLILNTAFVNKTEREAVLPLFKKFIDQRLKTVKPTPSQRK